MAFFKADIVLTVDVFLFRILIKEIFSFNVSGHSCFGLFLFIVVFVFARAHFPPPPSPSAHSPESKCRLTFFD